MTNSRGRTATLPALVLTLSLGICVDVRAQTAAPGTPPSDATAPMATTETPAPAPPSSAPAGAPRRLIPSAAPTRLAPNPNSPEAPPASVRRATGIQVDGLTRIDGDSLGALREQDGGLGPEMWQGVTRTQAVNLINALPRKPGSHTLRNLQTRLLLTRAKAPVAVDANAPSLLAARAAALLAMGSIEDTELLLSVSPTQGRPDGLDPIDARIQLLNFDNARACGLARNNQQSASEDFWQRMLIYCDALDGKADSVALGISLLRETSGDDPALALLADSVLSSSPITLETIANPNQFHLALSRVAKVELPTDIATASDPVVIYGAAMAPNLPLGSRIEAAEKGVAEGIVNPQVLRRLYSQVDYVDADLDNALTRAAVVGGQAARALLYQAAARQNIPVARGEIIVSALEAARQDERYRPVLIAFKPLIDRIPPSPEMAWFALTAVRGYLTLGDRVGTEKWMALLRASASVNPDAQLALNRVRPLAWVLGVGADRVQLSEMLSTWRASLEARPELLPTQALMNATIMALGADLPSSAWDGTALSSPANVRMPAATDWLQFRDVMLRWNTQMNSERRQAMASAGNDMPSGGATRSLGVAAPIIRTIIVMGDADDGPQSTHTIYEAISALRQIGLIDDARQLAVETLIAAGL